MNINNEVKALVTKLEQHPRKLNCIFNNSIFEEIFPTKTLMDVFGEELCIEVSKLKGEVVSDRVNSEHDYISDKKGKVEVKGVQVSSTGKIMANQIRPLKDFDTLMIVGVTANSVKIYECAKADISSLPFLKTNNGNCIQDFFKVEKSDKFTLIAEATL